MRVKVARTQVMRNQWSVTSQEEKKDGGGQLCL